MVTLLIYCHKSIVYTKSLIPMKLKLFLASFLMLAFTLASVDSYSQLERKELTGSKVQSSRSSAKCK